MKREEIIQTLLGIIQATFTERAENVNLTESTNIIEELKLDSMEVVTIMVKAEVAFDVEINEEDINDTLVNPISNLVTYIERKKALSK